MPFDPNPQQRALAQDPADAASLQQLALLAREAGEELRAVQLFVRGAHLHGDRAALRRQLAQTVAALLTRVEALVVAEAVDEAAALLERMAGYLPPGRHVLHSLGVLRVIQGRDAEAEQLHAVLQEPDSRLGTAAAALAARRAETQFVGTVVIPVYKMEGTIGRALDSVAAAVDFHRRASKQPQAQIHICVVDDASPDDTALQVLRWGKAHPDKSVSLIANNHNRGAGTARNIGAAAARGDYLWFLDADDFFFERHLFLTARALDQHPHLGWVRTAMHLESIDEEIRPEWRAAAENTYPCNLCLRRVCHDAVGGFPEEAPFRPAFCDDVLYARVLHELFQGGLITEKTVHYSLRDGNALARQKDKFVGLPDPGAGAAPSAREMVLDLFMRRRLYETKRKWTAVSREGGWTGPPFAFLTAGGALP